VDPTTKISTHFEYHEFFSSGLLYNQSESFMRKLLDPRLVPLMELIRSTFDNPVYCNNWYWGGNMMYRGFRPWTTPFGVPYSQHKFGRAMDFNVKDITPDEVRSYILNHQSMFMNAGLTRIEDGRDATTWVHVDLAWTGQNSIVTFRDI